MTTRCAFLPTYSEVFFREELVEFEYVNGLAASQRFKSATNLQFSARQKFLGLNGLEVSRYSDSPLGVSLSAFNLKIQLPEIGLIAIENLFQSSKVFERGGPFLDLLRVSPFEAKKDERIKGSGALIEFRLGNDAWPLESGTDFYDFHYIKALSQKKDLLENLASFDYFTDIACNKTALGFQKGKTFSTQARSCAIAVGLFRKGILSESIQSQSNYWATLGREFKQGDQSSNSQPSLFDF